VKIVLDTNVFVSGVFFTGPPYQILQAWRDGRLQIVLSRDILVEYQRVGERLAEQFPHVHLAPLIELVAVKGKRVRALRLPAPVCDDPDDDKFLACALAGRCKVIVSGDKHLLKVSGYRGIKVMRPKNFVEEWLR
jgi:putative PIN family toxin of toxin-antitoxin system